MYDYHRSVNCTSLKENNVVCKTVKYVIVATFEYDGEGWWVVPSKSGNSTVSRLFSGDLEL